MGKANRVKVEYNEVREMSSLIQTLKDIADNKYFTLLNQRSEFQRFEVMFRDYFSLLSMTDATHPLINNNHSRVAIIVVTIEGSFLAEFNNKIIRRSIEEFEKYDDVRFIMLGEKGLDRFTPLTSSIKQFPALNTNNFEETASAIKDYVVEEIVNGHLGKVMICYAYPKDFDTQKVRFKKLLPCEELIGQSKPTFSDFKKVFIESDPSQIIARLANLWVSSRLVEYFVDTNISSAAAQSSFLDESLDRVNKDVKKMRMKFLKAKKSDIDKSLREIFSARMLVGST